MKKAGVPQGPKEVEQTISSMDKVEQVPPKTDLEVLDWIKNEAAKKEQKGRPTLN